MRRFGNGRKTAGNLLVGLLFSVCLFGGGLAFALEQLDDNALASVDAQAGPVTISVEQDTVRLFFDTYIETYAEVDQVRMGYYYKDKVDLVTRKGMNPHDDPRVEWDSEIVDGHKCFQVNYGGYGEDGDKGSLTPERYAVEYELVKDEELEREYVPWTDDDLYMAKFNNTLGDKWVDGVQGDNTEMSYFSKYTRQNRNYLDWDISLDNVRLGASPDNPAIINGLVVRLKYDNINSNDRRLTDIIIGTNDMQADLMVDFRRATGIYSPKNAYRSRQLGLFGVLQGPNDLAREFNSTPVPVILQRDSMLMLVDHYYFGRDYRDPDGEAFMTAVPDNPTSSSAHSGMFLRIGLDRESPHFGYQVITGYNELIASSFQYRGEHINESLYKWWHGKEPSAATHSYPEYLPDSPYYPSN